jgi:O-antigen/teichoic acid export membrane protein
MNLAALTLIQVANALLPIIAYPLILSAVGLVPYSRIVVTESVALVGLSLVIYSFEVEGASRIANLDPAADRTRISTLFSDILLVRLIIMAACAFALLVASPLLDSTTFRLLLCWLLFPLAYVFQAAWFYQGLERNVAHAVAIVISRLGCLVAVRLFIKSPEDFVNAPLIIGGCYFAGGLSLTLYAMVRYGVRLTPFSPSRARELLWNGKEIFLGNLSVTLYRDSNVLILNAISTGPVVAVYSIAEKAIKVFQAGARPLNQLFFPRVIRALQGIPAPDNRAFRAVLRYTIPQLGLLALGVALTAVGVVLFRERLPAPFQSEQSGQILGLISIMVVSVFFGVGNFMFGTGGLNYLGRRAHLAKSILLTGVCSLAASAALVSVFGATGAALGFVLAEALLFFFIVRAYRSPTPE